MFDKSAKDLYNEYHLATNEAAREYWYQCLKTRMDINIERPRAQYYLNRIDRAKLILENDNGQAQS